MAPSRCTWAMYCRRDGWLVKLVEGWRLPWIVGPIGGYELRGGEFAPAVNHGTYSILLTREDEPNLQPGGML